MSRPIAPDVRLYTRADWDARPPRGAMTKQPEPHEAFLHYDSNPNAEAITTLAEQKQAMRNIQAAHQDGNGWSDGGYHYVIFQPYGNLTKARAFELRPVWFVPAAQQDHNTGTLAIQVYAGPGDPLKKATERAILAVLKQHRSLQTLGGHRDVVATACPGDVVWGHLPRLARQARLRRYR